MYKHHQESIKNITEKLKTKKEIQAVILCGSIAHGFETEKSDVDLMLVVSDKDYKTRKKAGEIHYFEKEACTYESGYIDGKYISRDFLQQVAERGSEPARYAFEGAQVTYSQIKGLNELLKEIVRYPVEQKEEKIGRFYAQFEAWKWYCEEAIKHNNLYLLNHSVSNFILFSGRMILAHNEVLYPYHKWFLRVLDQVKKKPNGLMGGINLLLKEPNQENINHFYQLIKEYREWEEPNINWPGMFMLDCELSWMTGNVPVADI